MSDVESTYYIEDAAERERAREELRFKDGKYTEFGLAEIERDAYYKYVPEQHIDGYVDYYTIVGEGKPTDWPDTVSYWEDDWFLMENQDYYREVYLGILGLQKRDFSKVPTREIGAKYITYKKMDTGMERDQYRIDNPDLDEWGVSVGIWTRTMSEKRKRMGISGLEKFIQGLEDRSRQLWGGT
jgi:hypothetical protein